jgi:hypothetical protein
MNAIDPAHYRGATLQTRDIFRAYRLGPDLANVVKYLCRYDHKNGREDLSKAARYLRMFAEDSGAIQIQLLLWHSDPVGFPHMNSLSVAKDFGGANKTKTDLLSLALLLPIGRTDTLVNRVEFLASLIESTF